MFGYVVFAAIVLFQTEIRRTLAHLGRARFFRYFTRTDRTTRLVEELVVAATMLASQRTGAIIAVERDIGLRNYIEGGIPLDATLTYDLLLSIFQPRSPLHDGAVIVQGDRIAAAACFLPLTRQPGDQQGLRHAAPRGHRPDRGDRRGDHRGVRGDGPHLAGARRAHRARARRRPPARAPAARSCRSGKAVRERAREGRSTDGLQPLPQSRAQGHRRWCIAVLLWLAVGGEKVVERSLRVAARAAEHARRPRGGRRHAQHRGRARAGLVEHARRSCRPATSWRCSICRRRAPGRRLFHLAPDHVRVPFGVEVTYVGPATLPLVSSGPGSKSSRWRPPSKGSPPPGYVVETITVEPAEVEVIGPESALRDLKQATTEPVDLDGRDGLGPRDGHHRRARTARRACASPAQGRVFVEVAPVRTERTVHGACPSACRTCAPGSAPARRRRTSRSPSAATTTC